MVVWFSILSAYEADITSPGCLRKRPGEVCILVAEESDCVVFDGLDLFGGSYFGGVVVAGGGFEFLHDGEDEGGRKETDDDEDAPDESHGDFTPEEHRDRNKVVADSCSCKPATHHRAFEFRRSNFRNE